MYFDENHSNYASMPCFEWSSHHSGQNSHAPWLQKCAVVTLGLLTWHARHEVEKKADRRVLGLLILSSSLLLFSSVTLKVLKQRKMQMLATARRLPSHRLLEPAYSHFNTSHIC